MRRGAALPAAVAAALLLAGCGQSGGQPARVYAHWTDRMRAATHDLFGLPCLRGDGRLPDGQCFRMTAPMRMRGLWVDEVEGSLFYPGLAAPPAQDGRDPSVWLDAESGGIVSLKRQPGAETRMLLIDFVGRRTLYPGHYGHIGVSDHLVVVDRLIAARPLTAADVRPTSSGPHR